MSKKNPLPYISQYQSFDTIVHQSTNSRGMAQSFWAVSVIYKPFPSPISDAENFNVNSLKRMALDDNASVFCTYGKLMEQDVYIAIMFFDRAKSNRSYINLIQEEGSTGWNGTELKEIPLSSTTSRLQTTTNIGEYLSIYGADVETVNLLSDRYGLVYSTSVVTDGTSHSSISINSTPTFDINDGDSILKYIDDGDKSGALEDYSVNWTVYLSDSNTPQIKLVWRSNQLEQLFRDGTENSENVYINLYTYKDNEIDNKVIIESVKYSQSYITSSFMNIADINNPDVAEAIRKPSPSNSIDQLRSVIFYFELYTSKGLYSKGQVEMSYAKIYLGQPLPDSPLDTSTVTIIIGTGDNDNGYNPPVNDDTVDNATGSVDGYTALNLLSTTYKITETSLIDLSKQLWSKDFDTIIRQINSSPIENIISCKIIPYNVDGIADKVVLGNYNTNIVGYIINKNVKIILGEIEVPEYYNSFLDYAPYTKITIFIPYIGFKELDTSQFMNRTLKIEYIIDVVTASCKALLFANGIYVQSFDGQCGIDIPITASNRAQVEASYISGALGAIGELASGDVIGAVSGALSTAMTPYHYNTQGAYNPSCGSFETKLCYLIIDRPTADYPTSYGHNFGYPCGLTKNLSTLKGFTKCGGDIDLSSCPATETEKKEIKQLLLSGIIL